MTTNPSHQTAPITWADLIHVMDSHGVRPIKNKVSKTARPIHLAYERWVQQQGIVPKLGYLMPMYLLTGTVRQVLLASNGRRPDNAKLRALIVDAINDPHGGLEIALRPYRQQGAA